MKPAKIVVIIVLFTGFLFSTSSCAVRVQPENRTQVRWYQNSNHIQQQRYPRHNHSRNSNQVKIRLEDRD